MTRSAQSTPVIASTQAAVGASTRWPDGDGAAGERGASNTHRAPAAPDGHPAAGLPGRRLTAANPPATVGGNAGSPDGAGAAREMSGLASTLAVPDGHPAAHVDMPWSTFCRDACARPQRLLAYPTGSLGLVLKFPPGESATLGVRGLRSLIEVADFASWWLS